MNLLRFQRYDILVSLACLALLSSFAWYAFKGPRGYDYRIGLEVKIAELADENAELAGEKLVLEKRVQLLRPESVDRDMLEELAKSDLKMVYANELVVRTDKLNPVAK